MNECASDSGRKGSTLLPRVNGSSGTLPRAGTQGRQKRHTPQGQILRVCQNHLIRKIIF